MRFGVWSALLPAGWVALGHPDLAEPQVTLQKTGLISAVSAHMAAGWGDNGGDS